MVVLSFIDRVTDIESLIVEFIQKMQNGFFDFIFKAITQLGDRFFFILLAAIAYWIYDKRFAFKLTLGYLGSSVVTGLLKVGIKRVRPYNDVRQGWIEPIGPKETSGSFPSGHATSTGSLSYSIFTENKGKHKWIKWVLLAYMILVPFSRMYLGHHYPTDLLAGLIVGVFVTMFIFKVIDLFGEKEHIYALALIPVALVVLIVGETVLKRDYDYGQIKDLYVIAGSLVGFVGGYFLEKKYIEYDVKAPWKTQLLKVLLGLAITLALYFGLSGIFKAIKPENLVLDFIRYTIVAFYVAVGAPWMFKKIFSKQDDKQKKVQ